VPDSLLIISHFLLRARTEAPQIKHLLELSKRGMPHEVATGLDDFECAGFRVAGPGGLAPAENQGSICQRWGRER
jgi:hypothetical protein